MFNVNSTIIKEMPYFQRQPHPLPLDRLLPLENRDPGIVWSGHPGPYREHYLGCHCFVVLYEMWVYKSGSLYVFYSIPIMHLEIRIQLMHMYFHTMSQDPFSGSFHKVGLTHTGSLCKWPVTLWLLTHVALFRKSIRVPSMEFLSKIVSVPESPLYRFST